MKKHFIKFTLFICILTIPILGIIPIIVISESILPSYIMIALIAFWGLLWATSFTALIDYIVDKFEK